VSPANDPGPDEVEEQAAALDRDAEAMAPTAALQAARAQLRRVDPSLNRAVRDHQRRPFHRAASMTAVVCARASRWCGLDGRGWVALAEAQATAAGDGPLLARARLVRATAEGEHARMADLPFPERIALASAALEHAGSRPEQADIRALAHLELAWERAAVSEKYGAHMELAAATFEAQQAGWSEMIIDSYVGPRLRKLGLPVLADHALSAALDTAPVRRVWVLCALARTWAATGDEDGAAEALREAWLLTRAHGIAGRVGYVTAARSILRPSRVVDALDELMRST
jgi:hypothetical protein